MSDEFDRERLWFYGFVLIPGGILFPYSLFLYKSHWERHATARKFIAVLIVAGNLWGISLILNAVSSDEHVTYTRLMKSRAEQRSFRVAYRRGGLGFLYRLRW